MEFPLLTVCEPHNGSGKDLCRPSGQLYSDFIRAAALFALNRSQAVIRSGFMRHIRHIKTFISGIASGVMVGIGGAVYMSCESRYVGAVLFSVALLSICCLGLYLYTGKIGFFAKDFTVENALSLVVGILGNFVGATATGLLCSYSLPGLVERAVSVCTSKLALGAGKAIVLGAFCGVLMFVAVKIYRENKTLLGVLFCIPVFILCGFEHSIADMYYFALAGMISLEYLGFILCVILGNTVGSIAICLLTEPFAGPSEKDKKENSAK